MVCSPNKLVFQSANCLSNSAIQNQRKVSWCLIFVIYFDISRLLWYVPAPINNRLIYHSIELYNTLWMVYNTSILPSTVWVLIYVISPSVLQVNQIGNTTRSATGILLYCKVTLKESCKSESIILPHFIYPEKLGRVSSKFLSRPLSSTTSYAVSYPTMP